MNSKLRVREALDVLYMQGEDAGDYDHLLQTPIKLIRRII